MKYPAVDHTLGAPDGHYIKVTLSNQVVPITYTIKSDFAQNITQPGPPNQLKLMCLKFWYYMGVGSQTNNDFITISTNRNKSLDSISGAEVLSLKLQNQWLYRRFNFKLAVNDVVSINGQTSGTQSVVAFDDIQIQKQSCELPGWCDFENGMSLFYHVYYFELINLKRELKNKNCKQCR